MAAKIGIIDSFDVLWEKRISLSVYVIFLLLLQVHELSKQEMVEGKAYLPNLAAAQVFCLECDEVYIHNSLLLALYLAPDIASLFWSCNDDGYSHITSLQKAIQPLIKKSPTCYLAAKALAPSSFSLYILLAVLK